MSDKRDNNSTPPKSPLGDLGVRDLGVNMFYGAPQILFQFAKELRNKPTEAESFLWNFLSGSELSGIRFKRQHPILYFIADFYCHKAKLIIEIDGGYHQLPEQYLYDKNRDNELEMLGLKTIRFTNEQVFLETEKVLNVIKEEVKNRIEPLNPLKGTLE
jgi:cyclase